MAKASVEPRAQSIQYVEALRGLVHGINQIGVPVRWAGITVLDDAVLVEELEALGTPLRAHWRSEEFAARRDADVREWLIARSDSDIPGSTDHVEKTLCDAGLGHLRDLL
jgi:hypothetical protein